MALDFQINLLRITTSKMEQTLSIIKPDAIERNLHDKIKEIGCIILEYSGMVHQSYLNSDGLPWTEGIVFPFKEGDVKLTGRFQEFNSTQGNYKND